MLNFPVAAGCNSTTSSPNPSVDDAGAKEKEAIKGTWKVVKQVIDGRKASEEEVKDVVVIRDGEVKVTIRRGEQLLFEAIGKVTDRSKNPRLFESTQTSEGPNNGKVSLGIYELDGDTMKVCTVPPGLDRPEFASKPGSRHVFVVTKRVSP